MFLAEEARHTPNPILPIWQEIDHRRDRVRAPLLRADEVRLPPHGGDVRGPGRGDRGRHRAGPRRRRPRPTCCSSSTRRSWPRPAPRPPGSGDEARPTPRASARMCWPRRARSPTASSRPARSSCTAERQSIVRELRAEMGTLAVDLAEQDRRRVARRRGAPRGTVERFLADLETGRRRRRSRCRQPAASRTPPRSARWMARARATVRGPGRRGRRDPRVRRAARAEPRLRRALSDPARTGDERAELLGRCSRARCRPTPPTCSRTLVAGRWSAPSELLDATERLGVEALLASAERPAIWPRWRTSCSASGRSSPATPSSPPRSATRTAPAGARAELVHALLEGKAKPATVRLVELALRGFGGRNFAASLTRLVELAAERRERRSPTSPWPAPTRRGARSAARRPAGARSTAARCAEGHRGPGGPRRRERPGRTRPVRRHRGPAPDQTRDALAGK